MKVSTEIGNSTKRSRPESEEDVWFRFSQREVLILMLGYAIGMLVTGIVIFTGH